MHSPKQHISLKENSRRKRASAVELTAAILKQCFAECPGPVLIAVGGPGGTGKSTFARRLAEALDDTAVLELDHYKTSRAARQKTNLFGPHPDANRMQLIREHLEALRRGQITAVPVYDRTTGRAEHTRPLVPARWIVVEGEISTYARFRDLIDVAIFIDSDWRTQLATRLGRDLAARGYSLDKAIATFLHSNLREFAEHGAASKQWADLHLFCHDDYRLDVESIAQPLYEKVRNGLLDSASTVDPEGVIVPLLTPFAADGSIATRALVEHLDWLTRAGVQRILLGGQAGEGSSLRAVEKLQVLKLGSEYFPGLILFEPGGGPLPEAVELAEQAAALGADGIVCSCPGGCADAAPEGIREYLEQVHGASNLPVFFDCETPWPLPVSPDYLRHLPFRGLIDADRLPTGWVPGTPRFLGDRACAKGQLAATAAGLICTAANAVPELFLAWERLAYSDVQHPGSGVEKEKIRADIKQVMTSLNSSGGRICASKHLLAARLDDYPTSVRPPLAELLGVRPQVDCSRPTQTAPACQ